MADELGIGMLGFGMAGELFHGPFIDATPGLRLEMIRTSNPELIAKARKLHPGARITPNEKEVLTDPDIDIVVVATPNEYHLQLASQAMEQGKHVIVDKPFTITVEEADELIKISQQSGQILSVYQNRRWDGDFQTLRDVLDSGKLGRVVEAELHFDRFRPNVKDNWRETSVPGSGLLYDLGPHLIDQAFVLFGNPSHVYAVLDVLREQGTQTDYFDIRLDYPDGKRVHLRCSIFVKAPGIKYLVHGTNGSFMKVGMDPQEDALKDGKLPETTQGWGEEAKSQYGELHYVEDNEDKIEVVKTRAGNYGIYYEQFRDAVLTGSEVPVSAEYGLKTMKIIEAAIKSNELGSKCKVDL